MKIYVAGKWEEKERVREVMYELTKVGHTITYDWTVIDEKDASLTDQAFFDMNGVKAADALVAVFEKDLPYKGALAEVGGALALSKPVYILGNFPPNFIFYWHPLVKKGYTVFNLELLNALR